MPVKIGTMTTSASPFEIVHETGGRVQEKDNSFAEDLFDQQSEVKIRKFLRADFQLSLIWRQFFYCKNYRAAL